MSETANDNYSVYYADKLWSLLPAVYRALDTDQFAAKGPLRELANRIGETAAALRRNSDRLWEDQSIETCDDWVIPYIADLLDTRLVLGLDARGQRLDVAKTIDYRLRKGTLGVLEEIASDITGWDAKVVEFFRRLGRTRHSLDPPIGPAAERSSDIGRLQRAEGLVGPLTQSRIGGFADLRNVGGAQKSRTAFDEYFHTADIRRGEGLFGWHTIPHLGVFVWRLISLDVGPVTPVAVANCPGWYSFDPAGRDIPLFAPPRTTANFGDTWVSPVEGQLPGPISQALLDGDIIGDGDGLGLYPIALEVSQRLSQSPIDDEPLIPSTPLAASPLKLRPERGRFFYEGSSPSPPLVATYHYGFPSLIGAGPYDRRDQVLPVPQPDPPALLSGGGDVFATLASGAGTVVLNDSLTYDGAPDISVATSVTLRAANHQRPLIRLAVDQPWTITGASPDACLTLDGLFVSGQDIILAGEFAKVTLTNCTLDPGSAAPLDPGASSPALFDVAVDGRDLVPVRLIVKAAVKTLLIDRSVLGPVRAVTPGEVETASLSNSTIQAIRDVGEGPILAADVKDPDRLLRVFELGLDPVSQYLRSLDPGFEALLGTPASPPLSAAAPPLLDLAPLLERLNALLAAPSFYQWNAFGQTVLSAKTQAALTQAAANPSQPSPTLNRLLLEDAFPLELAPAALAFADGTLNLSRCTVLGRIQAHRLSASESILHELALVDDLQDGCTRFSAWSRASRIPRPYECVQIPQLAPLFTSTDFGHPAYAQLLETVDRQIIPPTTPSTAPPNVISAGAENGSEMGAYARDKNPIRAQALLLKLQEYMPANLVPVIVNVT